MVNLKAFLYTWFDSSTEVSYSGARERAARGASYLDEVDPGWHERLDADRLQLANGSACVLGQLHGEFRMGLGRSSLFNMGSAPRASLSPVRYGFLSVRGVSDARQEADYDYLNQAWMEEVKKRQGAPVAQDRVDCTRSASRELVPME